MFFWVHKMSFNCFFFGQASFLVKSIGKLIVSIVKLLVKNFITGNFSI